MSATLIESAKANPALAGYELNITRVFDAPRELVWKAWTDPEMVMQWKGPRGFKVTEYVSADEPGGAWRLSMEGQRPGSADMVKLRQHGVVKEMRPPELLVFTFAWDDRSTVGLPMSPFEENIVTIRLEERGDKTVMHFSQGPFATEGERDGHGSGWNSSFDRFADFMLAEQPERKAADEVPSELHLRRFFAAPRHLVFDAWTKPELVKEWWGPKGWTIPHCEIDARQGGEFMIQMKMPDGPLCGLKGRYAEFHPPYRFRFIGTPLDKDGNAVCETSTSVYFEEKDGGTEVILDGHYTKSPANPAAGIKGSREGWIQMFDKLATLVGKCS